MSFSLRGGVNSAPIPHFTPSDLISTTRIQDGDLVSVEGLIVPGPSTDDRPGFWIADDWYPFAKEPLVRVVASPPKEYDVVHVYGRVHWENGKAVLYPAEVKSAWHSWEWWLAHKAEFEAWWAELVEASAYSVSVGDSAANVTVQSLLDNPPPDETIAYAKWLADGQSVELSGKVVSAGTNWFSGCVYIQEPDGACGIRVNTSGSFASGDVVSVSGTMGTESGERVILNATVEKTGTTDAPIPLTLNNRTTGGGPFLYDEGPPEHGQKGVIDDAEAPKPSFGLNNIGLLVRTTGVATYADPNGDFIYIDDGSGLEDGSGNIGVRVTADELAVGNSVVLPPEDAYAIIAGILSTNVINGKVVRRLRPRSQDDIGGVKVQITTPPDGSTVTLASNSANQPVPIKGTVTSALKGVSQVLVKLDNGNATAASVQGETWEHAGWPLSPGSHTLTATATDNAGNESTDISHITVSVKGVIYVKTSGSDNNNGLSWSAAKKTIQAGINAASAGQDVWVAQGTYGEVVAPSQDDTQLYGGFAEIEIYREQRDWRSNVTTIQGVPSYYCAVELLEVDNVTVDGFHITNINTSGSGVQVYLASGTVRNCVITGNYFNEMGAGVGVGDGSLNLIANTIADNHTTYIGGGVCVSAGANVNMANNIIVGNTAASGAGLSVDHGGHAISTNDTIAGNSATSYGGGGVCVWTTGYASGLVMTNSIVAFNTAPSGSCISKDSTCTLTVTYSDLYGTGQLFYGCNPLDPAHPEWHNISVDPLFVAPWSSDYHLANGSLCIDVGNSAAPGLPDKDFEGDERVIGDEVDMGADESEGTMLQAPPRIVRVTTTGNDGNDGSDWDDDHAMRTVQAAINTAAPYRVEVWVKQGTYNERITLRDNAYVYGGFAGIEHRLEQRPPFPRPTPDPNETILDGQQGGSVVTISQGVCGAVIDGFTIRNGAAGQGGGIYCSDFIPRIANNTITGNSATGDGGGVYCNGGSPEIRGNIIRNNTAGYEGGGVHCEVSSATITANLFESNIGVDHAGAIALHNSSDVSIVNNLFVGNSCTGLSWLGGGAIHARYSGPLIANNTFVDNRVGTGEWPNNFVPYAYGGAIHVRGTPETQITNNVFYGNRADKGNSVGFTQEGVGIINYCDAYPNNGASYHYYDEGNPPSYLPPGLDAGTCTYYDPLFYLTGEHPYWLKSDPPSPVRGIGLDPAQGNGVPTTDKDGRPRPGANGTTDMGAYEDNP